MASIHLASPAKFFRNQVASICVKPPFGGLADVLLAGRAVAEFLAR
jgi:hypothetical protein